MQSRRNEDFASQSSFGRSGRNRDLDGDSYLMMSPHSKRSWSPRRTEASSYSQRVLNGRRSASLERRRGFDAGSRRIRSRSPTGAKRGGPFYADDRVVDRDFPAPERRARYEFFGRMDVKHDDVDSPMRNEFGYGHGSSRTATIDDKFEGRRLGSGMGEVMNRKHAFAGLHGPTGEMNPKSKNEIGRDLSSGLLNIGLGQLGNDRARYPDIRGPYSFDKKYASEEKNMVHPRDNSYSNLTASRFKEPASASHSKDYALASPRNSRVDPLAYRGGIPLPRDNHPLNSVNTPDPLSHSRYEQRQHVDLGRDPDPNYNEDMDRYRREAFSPPRTGHLDSLRLQPQLRGRLESLYPSDDIYDKMNMHERVDYSNRERVDYSHRDMLKPSLLDRVPQRAETSDFARRNVENRSSLDHLSLEKLTAATSIGLSRSPADKRESAQNLDMAGVHSRLGRKIPRERQMPYTGMVHDRKIEQVRLDYDYEEDVDTGYQKERMRNQPGYSYDEERHRLSERTHKMEDYDPSPYGSSSRFLKRKYPMDDEENRITSRTMVNRLDTNTRKRNHELYDDEWIEEHARGSHYTKRRDHAHGFSRRENNDYDEADPMSVEWFSNDPEEFITNHPMKSYKYEDKYAKGYLRSGGRDGYNSYHSNRKHIPPKWKNVPIRRENDKEFNMHAGERENEDWASRAKPEPREDSDEFKQLVHTYFLSFTKKLNEATGMRRRYMEQGRAGSLFCIVCGRSLSKEFLDAQRLATHAFMSHKVGLRAQHLGLHKAICVMLGWNSTIPADTITWSPEPLSSTESMAQREDLIIWPPVVVVHNISITNTDSDGQGPTTIEALGQFLRGKGLSGGKIRLGKHANGSIMLVKFLGTFSALQEAKKIHEYFTKNKHGRKDLEQITSSKGKSKGGDGSGEGENGNGEKDVLFGYMGIAEDLEKVDFDTKKKCLIKSQKEIQDLADAPVKPE